MIVIVSYYGLFFREIVAAAHLKPLDKKDKLQITDDQPTGPWNPILTKNSNVTIRESNQTTSANEDSQVSAIKLLVPVWVITCTIAKGC